jgi:hypothetical protein
LWQPAKLAVRFDGLGFMAWSRQFGSIAMLLLAGQLLQPRNAQSQTIDNFFAKLNTRVNEYQVTEENFLEALCRVSRDFKIPVGITWISTSVARQKLSISWSDSTVQEIIEAISQTQPGYRVEIDRGIVHVFSEQIVPQQDFLLLKIPNFEITHQAIEVASVGLRELIKLTVSPPEPKCCGTGGSIFGNTDEPKLDLHFTDANVLDILDALAVNSASNIWIVTSSNNPVVTATGFRRTESLWNNLPIPESEQPVWDRIRWGDPLPSGAHRSQ